MTAADDVSASAGEATSAAGARAESTPTPATPEATLPPLSDRDFKTYNRLADHMDLFHNHFRMEWNHLYQSCEAGKRSKGQSIRSFIGSGLQFCEHLTMHHGIEEHRVFPMLARKMPAFRKQDELIGQHKQIHKGLEKMEAYLVACETGERELRLVELKEIMDSFGKVLWEHLDDEVRTLGAENMRKYWSKEEMQRLYL
ncbi:hypothetical protein CAC42_6139 [Sphaceloma murrayae]|uniref:Hemerythrin-like domain-containing protein n=1 Tax=Sphaceloma murrayae TaxID=2082308 RepID=A0A2K1QTC8_9PEZI|nr:hypothetical protein CAC42_6139 [Sphaceloma murrayae]